jgi:hypothetical protein
MCDQADITRSLREVAFAFCVKVGPLAGSKRNGIPQHRPLGCNMLQCYSWYQSIRHFFAPPKYIWLPGGRMSNADPTRPEFRV